MKAKALKPFIDGKEGVTRKPGDTFALSKERYEEINSTRFGALVAEVVEAKLQAKRSSPKRGD